MKRLRVLLANYPIMIPDAIRQLVRDQEDMEVVGDCRGPMKILQETGRTKADAVVLAQEGTAELGLCSQLLAVYPDLTIVSVTSNGTLGYAQYLYARRKQFVSAKEQNIIQALRVTTQSFYHEEDAP